MFEVSHIIEKLWMVATTLFTVHITLTPLLKRNKKPFAYYDTQATCKKGPALPCPCHREQWAHKNSPIFLEAFLCQSFFLYQYLRAAIRTLSMQWRKWFVSKQEWRWNWLFLIALHLGGFLLLLLISLWIVSGEGMGVKNESTTRQQNNKKRLR